MKTSISSFLSFCAVWCFLVAPIAAGSEKVGYIFTGRFYLEGADPLGINGAHFVLTAAVDADAQSISFVDHGDYQGTAVYPSGSYMTIWGAQNEALNGAYLPSAGSPDTVTAGWTSHSATDKLTFNATFLLNDGAFEQPISMPRFYVGLDYGCIYSLPCVPTIEWVYSDPFDLYGESFSTRDVFGQSFSLEFQGAEDEAALALQYVVDAIAQVVPKLGDSVFDPLWISADHRPVFDALAPYYASVAQGPTDLRVTDPNGMVLDKDLAGLVGIAYLKTTLGVGGSPADFAFFFNPLPGEYEIAVTPEPEAAAEDSFFLIGVDRAQSGARVRLLADGQEFGTAGSFSYHDFSGILQVVVAVKPGSCPTAVNLASQGEITVAILGQANFDVFEIDPASVRINDRHPVRWSLEDVARPSDGGPGCDGPARPDGTVDLVLKFHTADLRGSLAGLTREQTAEIQITGELKEEFGRWPFTGTDKIELRPRRWASRQPLVHRP